jgi:hypothetical protein
MRVMGADFWIVGRVALAAAAAAIVDQLQSSPRRSREISPQLREWSFYPGTSPKGVVDIVHKVAIASAGNVTLTCQGTGTLACTAEIEQ